MTTRPPSPLELRLSAFADHELPEFDRHDVEALLVNDPQARSIHDALARGADAGRHALDDMLKEPVALDLVRTIKNADLPRKAVRLPHATPTGLALRPASLRAVAAGLALFAVGGAGGYILASQPAVDDTTIIGKPSADNRDWLDDIISNYRLYTRQPTRLTEIPSERSGDIMEWLTTGTGVSFRIPDLSGSNLVFAGARLVVADRTPVGMLFYKRADADSDDDLIAIGFSKNRRDTSKNAEEIRNDTGVVSWSTPISTFVIVGPSAAADLDDIAAKVAGLI